MPANMDLVAELGHLAAEADLEAALETLSPLERLMARHRAIFYRGLQARVLSFAQVSNLRFIATQPQKGSLPPWPES